MLRLTKIAFLLLLIISIVSCSKKDDPANDTTVKPTSPFTSTDLEFAQKLSKRWNVVSETGKNSATDSTNQYLFFEFNIYGTYLIAQNFGQPLAGSYTISGNPTTVNMPGVGTLQVVQITATEFNFVFTPENGSPVTIASGVSQEIASSANTDKLCGTWTVSEATIYQNGQPITQNNIGKVVFSKYGTYLYIQQSNSITAATLRPWKWFDSAENKVCYETSIQTPVSCQYYADVPSLTNSAMTFEQKDGSGNVVIRYKLTASL